jgi:thiol:disulfide interchange protein DsbD
MCRFLYILTVFLLAAEVNSQEFSVSLNNMERPRTELFYSREVPGIGDTLHLKVTIPQGWHINSNSVPDDFLVPSRIEPVAKDIEFDSVLWPKPFTMYNEVLNLDLLLLQDSFVISLPIKNMQNNCNPYDVKLKFTYQACSNICLAPKTIEVAFNAGNADLLQSEKKNSDLNNSENSFFIYILLAMLGGLLLNVMPCVLPVLFLKIFDLMKKSGESRRTTLGWGIATTGGIGFSFFVIATAIVVIRLTGNAVGWGFQFQYPAYTAAMALCIAVFALSLWGVFDIWMPGNLLHVWEKQSKKGGFGGAFAYGILLVLLSTPCSAPFLGTAVGFAFVASTGELFAIFASLAAGMSAPYLILSIFPQWTKKLPRPGQWMLVLKQFLGFPLLLTLVWLLWVFCRQAGIDASVKLGLLLCAAGFFAWLSGMLAKPGKPWWRFALLWLVFVFVCVLSWKLWISPPDFAEASNEETEWIPFSVKKLDSLQREGFAVWVNGSADWCITCKVNAKVTFENERVKELFAEKPIIKMRADYTNPNSEALNFFEKHGRGGVPFDLLLTSHGDAILLPELLTVYDVIEALEKAY